MYQIKILHKTKQKHCTVTEVKPIIFHGWGDLLV